MRVISTPPSVAEQLDQQLERSGAAFTAGHRVNGSYVVSGSGAIADMKFDSVSMQLSERGASIAIMMLVGMMLVGNGPSRLDKFKWLERGARRFAGTQGSAPAAGIMTKSFGQSPPGLLSRRASIGCLPMDYGSRTSRQTTQQARRIIAGRNPSRLDNTLSHQAILDKRKAQAT
jgi:hypothetical protein